MTTDPTFNLLGTALARDFKRDISYALKAGAIFPGGNNPTAIFQNALSNSIRDIETDRRGVLFQRFLRYGPFEGDEPTAPVLPGKTLTEAETVDVITFIYSFMVNSFKGAITELFAAAACQRLIDALRREGRLPDACRLFVGDSVSITNKPESAGLKGADLHILNMDRNSGEKRVRLAGFAEVKSGYKSPAAMSRQLEKHIHHVKHGMRIAGEYFPGNRISIGVGDEHKILRITVQPGDWLLPRNFSFKTKKGGRELVLDPAIPPTDKDIITSIGEDRYHISLRWSKEAFAAAAYEMTFWYMEKIGEVIYTERSGEPNPKPSNWGEITPAEAGRNAIKQMLYYAIRPYAIMEADGVISVKDSRIMQRAIALYNNYSFGYALGMNFRNTSGRREMLWPEDLDEIAENGCNMWGSRIRG